MLGSVRDFYSDFPSNMAVRGSCRIGNVLSSETSLFLNSVYMFLILKFLWRDPDSTVPAEPCNVETSKGFKNRVLSASAQEFWAQSWKAVGLKTQTALKI